jgi:hypothetical protein
VLPASNQYIGQNWNTYIQRRHERDTTLPLTQRQRQSINDRKKNSPWTYKKKTPVLVLKVDGNDIIREAESIPFGSCEDILHSYLPAHRRYIPVDNEWICSTRWGCPPEFWPTTDQEYKSIARFPGNDSDDDEYGSDEDDTPMDRLASAYMAEYDPFIKPQDLHWRPGQGTMRYRSDLDNGIVFLPARIHDLIVH